jgi:hypothetical protein
VLDRGAQAAARGAARCASQVLEHATQAMPTAPRRYLIVVPRPLPAAPLAVRRRYLAVAPKPLPAAPRRSRRRRRITQQMHSGVQWEGIPRGDVTSVSSGRWP